MVQRRRVFCVVTTRLSIRWQRITDSPTINALTRYPTGDRFTP